MKKLEILEEHVICELNNLFEKEGIPKDIAEQAGKITAKLATYHIENSIGFESRDYTNSLRK